MPDTVNISNLIHSIILEAGTVALPISQMRKLRCSKANNLLQTPRADEWRWWEVSPDGLNPGSTTLTHATENKQEESLTFGNWPGMQM